jgi:hypothetical protein
MHRTGTWLSIIISGLLGIFLLVWLWPAKEVRVPPKEMVTEKTKRQIKLDKPTKKSMDMTLTPIYLPPPPPPEPAELEVKQEAIRLEVLKPQRLLEKMAEEVKPMMPQTKTKLSELPREEIKPLKPTMKPTPAPTIKKIIVKPQRQKSDVKPQEKINLEARKIVNDVDKKVVRSGRTMLKLLEHGSGPKIEIIWPTHPQDREALFQVFTQCYGMIVAIMNAQGGLFVAEGKKRQPWKINMDRYSGFVRKSAGRDTSAQRRVVHDIRAYHQALVSGPAIRIFPRRMDAVLLGGLKKLVGAGYIKSTTIKAGYRINGHQVIVERVQADGRNVSGRIDLSRSLQASCLI